MLGVPAAVTQPSGLNPSIKSVVLFLPHIFDQFLCIDFWRVAIEYPHHRCPILVLQNMCGEKQPLTCLAI